MGVSSQAEERDHTESRTGTELGGAAFAETLNANRNAIADELGPMQEAIGYHPLHTVYYAGDGSDLEEWVSDNGIVTMKGVFSDAPGGADTPSNRGGCYVATAVYGSYDCPEVWTLRRFRDNVLAETWYGRLFIRLYYAVSPTAVKLFGDTEIFQDFFRARLDTLVSELQDEGFESAPYEDAVW